MWKAKRKKKFKNKKIYVHYGSNLFDPTKFTKPNYTWCKPYGLWASPKDATFGWKRFCESEEFNLERLEKSFEFELRKDAKILQIRSLKDAKPFFIKKNDEERSSYASHYLLDAEYKLDLNRIYKEFDGIELFFSNNYNEFHYASEIFSGWDVDSLIIWNYNKIKINEEKQEKLKKEAYKKEGNNIVSIFDEDYKEYLYSLCLPDKNNDYTRVLTEYLNNERGHCRHWHCELLELTKLLKESIWWYHCGDSINNFEEKYSLVDINNFQSRRSILLEWYKEIEKWIKIIRLVTNGLI